MKKPRIIVVIPHSHSWLWTSTCVASLLRHPPKVDGYNVRIVVVDNSPWSPAINSILRTRLGKLPGLHVVSNYKTNKFHASALDCIVERFQFDLLMTLETDVLALQSGWLRWFVDMLREGDYAVGMWHHEQFVNPSCTLYRGDTLRDMNKWCKGKAWLDSGRTDTNVLYGVPPDNLRWGDQFKLTAPLDPSFNLQLTGNNQLTEMIEWIAGPFAEKRGFAEGTILAEQPSGQLKGPGWYEPGQQLHHWATQVGYTYTICPNLTTHDSENTPLQTMYGPCMVTDAVTHKPVEHQPDPKRQLEAVELFGNAQTAHLWGGTRALDILKHEVTCDFVKKCTPSWLAREARFWKYVVPEDIQKQTLDLIRQHGWHITGQGNDIPGGDQRDKDAVDYIRSCYAEGGVTW